MGTIGAPGGLSESSIILEVARSGKFEGGRRGRFKRSNGGRSERLRRAAKNGSSSSSSSSSSFVKRAL